MTIFGDIIRGVSSVGVLAFALYGGAVLGPVTLAVVVVMIMIGTNSKP